MSALLLFCLGCVPFVLSFRAYPEPLIVSSLSAFLLLAMLLLLASFRSGGLRFGKVALVLFFVGVALMLHGSLLARDGIVQAALPGFSIVLCALVVAVFGGTEVRERERWAIFFTLGLLAGGVFNVVSAWAQWLGIDLGALFIRPDELNISGVYGNISQRNIFVSYLFITYFAMIFLVSDKAYGIRVGSLYAVLVGLTVALTGSRAAFLYALVALLLPLLTTQSKRSAWLWPGVCLTLALLFMQGVIYLYGDALTGIARFAGGDSVRLDEYGKAIAIFSENWLVGVGMQNYALSSFELSVRDGLPSATGEAWSHPHNLFLMLLAGCGLLGVLISVAVVWLVFRVLRQEERGGRWLFGVGALACVFIHSQLEYPLWMYGYFVVFCVLVGVVVEDAGWSLRRWGRGVVVTAMLGSMAIAVHAMYGYFVLVENYAAVDGAGENERRIHRVYSVAVNPIISEAADLVVLNYLVPSQKDWRGGYCLFERLAHKIPSYTLLDQMGFYAWYAGESALAERIFRARKIYYPKKDWVALEALFEQYYSLELVEQLDEFMKYEKNSFVNAEPFSITASQVCLR